MLLSLDGIQESDFYKKIVGEKKLAAGDELLVQVSREALKTKDPTVTTNLNFSGTYAVLTTGKTQLGVSAKLPKQKREHYMELLNTYAAPCAERTFGIVIRTNAASVSDETVLAELAHLMELYTQTVETAAHRTCYSCVYQEDETWEKVLQNVRVNTLAEIVTDDPAVFAKLCEKYGIGKEKLQTAGSVSVPIYEQLTKEGTVLRFYEDPLLSLPSLYGVSSQIQDALKEKVWLKSGAYLIIQPTEALTVIDVNTGKNTAKKEVQENFLKVNLEAAAEIARQLRLRNISGIIVVDFINLSSKEAEQELLETFQAALKKDSVPTQLVDMTQLGLVEITRKKVRKSLREIFL